MFTFGQAISVSNERENIVTVGIDNPISVAVEGLPAASLIIKTDNGDIQGENGRYVFRPVRVGPTAIMIFKKTNGKLKKIGEKYFRAKLLNDPVFRIGSGKSEMTKKELVVQDNVRATNSDLDIIYTIDSFRVCIFSRDTCKYSISQNFGNRLSEELKSRFQLIKNGDVIVFKDIYITQPDKSSTMIEPLIITIKE
jgi:hypothetical protein